MVLALLINIVINLFIIFFILRMTIEDREFFFSPVLQPIYRITEPVLSFIQNKIAFFDRRRYLSVILVVLLLIVLRGLFLALFNPIILVHSHLTHDMYYLRQPSVQLSVILSFMNFFDLLFQALIVFIISYTLTTPYSTNPISRFINFFLDPFLKLTSWLFSFLHKGIPLLTAIILIFCHFLLSLVLFHLSSFDIKQGLYSSEPGVINTQLLYSEQDPLSQPDSRPFWPLTRQKGLHTFSYGMIFYSTFNLVFMSLGFFSIIIIIGAIMSWFRPDPFNPLVQWIEVIGRPILAPFRRFIPSLGGIDISPIFAILVIEYGRKGLDTMLLVLVKLYLL